MFQQSDVTGHQRRRGKSKHLPERKIPGHDRQHRPERLILDVTFGGVGLRRFLLEKARSVLRVKPATARAFLDFCDRIAKQFAHLHRDDLRKLFLFLEQQLGRGVQQFGALDKRGSAIFAERFFGAAQALLDFCIAEGRKLLQLFTCGRIYRRNWHNVD